MTLLEYRIFHTVTQQGSFAQAAQVMHLTPSAISHAVSAMEEECGFQLFVRGRGGVTLTHTGESLYPLIRQVLDADADGKRQDEARHEADLDWHNTSPYDRERTEGLYITGYTVEVGASETALEAYDHYLCDDELNDDIMIVCEKYPVKEED